MGLLLAFELVENVRVAIQEFLIAFRHWLHHGMVGLNAIIRFDGLAGVVQIQITVEVGRIQLLFFFSGVGVPAHH